MITIENPVVEQQVKRLFGQDRQAFQTWLAQQLQTCLIQQQISTSEQDIAEGRLSPLDEAFQQVIDSLHQR